MNIAASDILALLAQVIDYVDGKADAEIIDGKMIPNEAMSILGACEHAYEEIEKAGGIANDLVTENHEGRSYWSHDG